MALSNITNLLTDLNGTPIAAVRVIARLIPGGFRIAEGSEIASQDETTSDAGGNWSIALERNANISPAGTYYEIEEQIPDLNGGPRIYPVSVGATNQTLQAALVSPIPSVSGPTYLTQTSADARYQQLGSLGSGTPATVATAATAGVSAAASREDHAHVLAASVVDAATLQLVAGVLSVKALGVGVPQLAASARAFEALTSQVFS